MEIIGTKGTGAALNIASGAFVLIPIDTTATSYTVGATENKRVEIHVKVTGGTVGATYTLRPKTGIGPGGSTRDIIGEDKKGVAATTGFRMKSNPIDLFGGAGNDDTVELTIASDNPADTAVTVLGTIVGIEDIGSVSGDAAAAASLKTLIENPLTAADNADAFWDEAAAAHVAAGSFGAQCGTDIDAILADTAEVQGKLPTNKFMGSSDGADDDGTLNTIATDTTTDIPALIATAQADLDTIAGTNGVFVDDNAITAAKYDESTAFPVKSADTGATQIARVGADSDTLETLSDQIDLLADAITEPMLNTTVGATVTSATVFNLTAGVANNDAYIDATICVMDNSNSSLAEWRTIVDYVGATKTVTLDRALSFTPETSTDEVIIKGKTRSNAVAGGSPNTYTVTDDGTAEGNAVQDVHVWVTTDSGGNTIVADGTTDSNGEAVFYLDAGETYYIWKHKAGFTFADQPETVVAV